MQRAGCCILTLEPGDIPQATARIGNALRIADCAADHVALGEVCAGQRKIALRADEETRVKERTRARCGRCSRLRMRQHLGQLLPPLTQVPAELPEGPQGSYYA